MRIKVYFIVTALLVSSVGGSIGYAVSVNPRVMRATSFTVAPVTPVSMPSLTPIPSGSLVPSGGPANPAGTRIPTTTIPRATVPRATVPVTSIPTTSIPTTKIPTTKITPVKPTTSPSPTTVEAQPKSKAGTTKPIGSKPTDTTVSEGCKEGDTKHEKSDEKEWSFLRGVEKAAIKDFKGYRGLPASQQGKIVDDTSTFLKVVGYAKAVEGLFNLGKAAVDGWGAFLTAILKQSIKAGYGKGVSDPAKDAIMDKLKEWQEKGALGGIPEWVDVELGPIWNQTITKVTPVDKTYVCRNKEWKYLSTSNGTPTYNKSDCLISGTYTERYTTNLENVPLEQCTAGKCSAAWIWAFQQAINNAFNKYKINTIGKCVK